VLAIQLIADLVAPIDRCAPQLGKTEIPKAKGSQKEKMPKIRSLSLTMAKSGVFTLGKRTRLRRDCFQKRHK
jgi:hypothetical protein